MAEIQFTEAEIAKAIALDKAKADLQLKIENERSLQAAKQREEEAAKKSKAESDAKLAKRAEVLKKINTEAEAFYDKQTVGTILSFTEKGGAVAPAIVIKESFKKVMEGDEGKQKEVLKLALTYLVFSVEAIQPYKTEVLY